MVLYDPVSNDQFCAYIDGHISMDLNCGDLVKEVAINWPGDKATQSRTWFFPLFYYFSDSFVIFFVLYKVRHEPFFTCVFIFFSNVCCLLCLSIFIQTWELQLIRDDFFSEYFWWIHPNFQEFFVQTRSCSHLSSNRSLTGILWTISDFIFLL